MESRQRRQRIAPDVSRGEAGSASSESLGDGRAFFGGCATTTIGRAPVETTIRYIENPQRPHRIPAAAAWVGRETRPPVVAGGFGGRSRENTLPSRRPQRTKRDLPGRGGRRDSLASSPFPPTHVGGYSLASRFGRDSCEPCAADYVAVYIFPGTAPHPYP